MKEQRVAYFDGTRGNSGLSSFIECSDLKPQDMGEMSPQQRVSYLFSDYLFAINNPGEEKKEPHFWLIEDNPAEFLEAVREKHDALEKNKTSRDDLAIRLLKYWKPFLESLTLIKLNSKTYSDIVSKETGIRVVKLKEGQTRFPSHPTPNS